MCRWNCASATSIRAPCTCSSEGRAVSSTVLYEARGEIARITLNRPDRLNTFNGAMFAELNTAIDRFRDDPALKAGVNVEAGKIVHPAVAASLA